MEHEHYLGSAEETLGNTEVNQTKTSVGIEQGVDENECNLIVVMHMVMMSDGKE